VLAPTTDRPACLDLADRLLTRIGTNAKIAGRAGVPDQLCVAGRSTVDAVSTASCGRKQTCKEPLDADDQGAKARKPDSRISEITL
jgi:hypothetical protein